MGNSALVWVLAGIALVATAVAGWLGTTLVRGRDRAGLALADHQARVAAERDRLDEQRHGLERREERLEERGSRLEAEQDQLKASAAELAASASQLAQAHTDLAEQRQALTQQLAEVAGLTPEQARTELLGQAQTQAHAEAVLIKRRIESQATHDADQVARAIIATAIQRLSVEQTSESVVSTVDLPNDDLKGRIIGREGRNIRAFEQVTGVNVLIDDTPGVVLLSCFDPVRREIARLALVDLVADGRIHLASIEAAVERSSERIADDMRTAAQDALAEMKIIDINPELVKLLGALRFRTSYGQNVLAHLVECGHLAALMAAELGLDVALCRRAAFLHDIGKAVTHESEGSHALVGAELAARYGESPQVVHAIEAHHNEVPPTTVEAVLTQAADAISASRPGARRQSLESYVQRLERLEQIAARHPGVTKAFAMQAGREVRVMVSPSDLDDEAAGSLARVIADEVQAQLTYPGEIRVTVVRETRVSEVAH